MKLLKNDLVPFLSRKEIEVFVSRLASQIEDDYRGRDLVLVCPLRGSIHFVTDLSRKLSLPLRIDFVYLRAVEKGGAIKIMKDISTNITGKHVLIVEEIIDSGRTLMFLKSRLQASHPASVRVVTLLDKPSRRELNIKPDYVGKTIDDRFVVGYGMDSEELGRNYPDIYCLKN